MLSRLVLRLTAPLIAVSLLLLAVGVFSAWFIHHMQQDSMALLAQSLESTEAAQEFEAKIVEMDIQLRQFAQTGNPEFLIRAAGLHTEANRWLVQTERLVYSSETQSLVREIRQQYMYVNNDIEQLRLLGRDDLAIQAAAQRIRPAELLDQARKQRTLNEQRLFEATRSSQQITDWAGRGLLILGICGSAAGLLAGYAMALRVQKSIVELRIPIRSAVGALDEVIGPIRVDPAASIESIRDELDRMADRVATVVSRLQQSQLETLRSEQLAAVGQLAAGLAHELRNPLTAIQTLVQSAREQGGAGAIDDRDLEIFEEELARLNHSIQGFLDFARPPKLERTPTSINTVLDRTLPLIAAKAKQQNVVISTDVPQDLPLICIDAEQFRQVFLNLLLNALDAQPTGGVIVIRGRLLPDDHAPEAQHPEESDTSEDATRIQIEFEDDGSGLEECTIGTIFDPFVSTKEAGSGLGLSICRRIIQDHGGVIRARNRPDAGAIFEIILPIAPSIDSQSPPEHP